MSFLDDDLDDWDDGPSGPGCAFNSLFLILAAMLIVVGWIFLHLRQAKALVGTTVLLVSVGVLAREAYRRIPRRRRRAKSGMPTPLAALQPGLATVAGLVGFTEQPRSAPLGAPRCVFYRVLVSTFDAPDEIVFESRSADAITLEDGAGAKLVLQLDGATWRMKRNHDRDTGSDPDGEVARFLAERGVVVSGPARVRVEWIAPHELVFARGWVRRVGDDSTGDYRTSHEAHFEMSVLPDAPLTISIEPLV